jgi:riboflavin kinase / FMN adenylyltransferase
LKVYRNINESIPKNCITTVGFFDGVHLGHKYLIEQLQNLAKEKSAPSLVITIWPHPLAVLGNKNPDLLNCLEEKIALIEKINPDGLLILDFNKSMASMSSEDFINTLLINNIKANYLLKGFNNSFGNKNLSNNIEANQNIEVITADKFLIDNIKLVNSTKIRKLINSGNVKEASNLLGYRYRLRGKIQHGYKIGRTIGFPTANLGEICSNKLIPANGVYYTMVKIRENTYPAMMNIGTRPTFGDNTKSIEFHIPNFHADLYNEELEVCFYDKIRDEEKFASLQDLMYRLELDKQLLLTYFKETL